jgi:DNA repair exonuclease SbcCD ATPase subunit
VVNSDYYKQRILELETNIEVLEKEQEAAREGRSKLLSLFGKGELSDAKKELSKKDAEIASLKKRIEELRNEKSALCQQHKQDIAKLRNGYKAEIDKAIREQERLQKAVSEKDARIAQQDKRIDELDRKANPQRYRLLSGAELVHYFIPNMMYPSLHIWTKVGNEEFENTRSVPYNLMKQFTEEKLTVHELVNEVFEPREQVNELQANLLGQAFILACGGEAQPHVGTGAGGSQSDLPWRDKDKRKKGGVQR